MELTKQPPLERLTAQYKVYIEALLTPDLKSQSRPNNLKSVYKSIVLATEFNKTGSTPEDEKTNRFLTENLYNELCVKFPYIHQGEIELALKKGVLGEFKDKFPKDKFIGINVSTLYQFVKFYLESEERKKAIAEWHILMDEENGIVRSDKPAAKIFELDEKSILSLYSDFLKDGYVPVYSRVYYDAICKIKGIKSLITQEQALEIEKKVKFQYERELIEKKVKSKTPDTFNILMNNFDRSSKTFAGMGKRIALKMYFEDCKFKNQPPV